MASQNNKEETRQTLRRRLRKLSLLQTLLVLGLTVANAKYRLTEATSESDKIANEGGLLSVDKNEGHLDESVNLAQSTVSSTHTNIDHHNTDDNDIIVVVAVDGTLAGISKHDGKVLWKHSRDLTSSAEERDSHTMKPNYNSKQSPNNIPERLIRPLVSTTTTTKSASSSDTKFAAVPSIDGNVFMSSCGDTVKNSVKELVARSPFLNDQGRFFVGSRHATAVALDGNTGEVLRIVPSLETGKDQDSNISFEGRNPVWIGRVDYSVTVQEARTGMTEVQFSVAEVISVAEMQGDIGTDAWKPMKGYTDEAFILDEAEGANRFRPLPGPENLFVRASSTIPTGSSPLVATPGGNIAFRNPKSGILEWVANETFDSPIAFAIEASSGVPVGVDIIPDVPVPGSSVEYLSREIEKQLERLDEQAMEDQTIVGAMSSGQLYALPLGGRQAFPGLKKQHHTIASASAANNPKQISTVPQIIGRSTIHYDGGHQREPHGGKNAVAAKKNFIPTSRNFPGCLVDKHGKEIVPLSQAARLPLDLVDRSGEDEESSDDGGLAIVTSHIPKEGGFYHPEFGYISPQAFQQYQRRSKYHGALRILGSWLPPTIALIFVLSFELGRRKRLKDRNAVKMEDGVGEVIWSDNKPTQASQQCFIQLSDEILGYGGQGTVVYKGMLEGRDVAVKRLLKAYQAGAEREISLLIESDGHPNVVRYFLKEFRGDFVYLALELCDLSLHDLIGVLRQQQEQQTNGNGSKVEPSISSSTRFVLQQITSGVEHLHSLRIVHRDLKPANILLATSKKGKKLGKQTDAVLETFQKGFYVAKISDMGLGKQLVGQSSLGVSMIGESTRGSKPGTSPVGVGPGSVGWQAPEVMALKGTSDSSAPSESPPAAVSESLPKESTPNTRTSRSVDIFSLGCIFYSTLVPGFHPFGEWYERESNIMHNRPSIEPLKKLSSDAYDLVCSMLRTNPKFRPTAKQICEHPFFWSSQQRLTFLCDFSDRLETDAISQTSIQSINVLAIERGAAEIVGTSWDKCLDGALINNVQRFRSYDPSSVRDLLRLIRNKHHHFDELPDYFRLSKMSNQDEMLQYFEARFPGLLMHCFNCCRHLLNEEDPLALKYLISPFPRQESKQGLSSKPSTVIVDTQDGRPPADALEDKCDSVVIAKDGLESSSVTIQAASGEKGGDIDRWLPKLDDEVENVAEKPSQDILSVGATIANTENIIVWEGSAAAKTFNCRGWSRSDYEWSNRIDPWFRKRDPNLKRAVDDPKFRTRLCNHWDTSLGTFCPMRKKTKCIFAHGPAELRVKEGKRNRWGKLLDKDGNNSNPWHSGGEDTYGAARSIETVRKVEGKWNTGKAKGNQRGKKKGGASKKNGTS
jgi:serine/threonine protein kinase